MTDNSLDLRAVEFSGLASRIRRLDASVLLWLVLIAVLAFLILNPVLRLIISSLQETDSGRFTLANYRTAYGNIRHLQSLLNSLELGVGVALLATCFAVPIAWAISRTDMPGKAFVRLMVFAAFVTPPYLGAIGWILLAGPNSGWLNKVWMALTGAPHGVFNIYSMTGLILVIAVTSFPYTFVFTSSALDLVSSEMEDAANILGARTLRTTLRITLPLVTPAIIGGIIISFLEAIALFGAPALIALPARFNVVSTQLWQFFEYPVRVEEAAAYSMPLLAITVLMFWLQRRILGRRGYTSVTGKGGERRMIALGPWRWVMLGYALLVCALSVFLPMLVLLQAAFAKAWGRGFSLDNLTLHNFYYLLVEQTQAKMTIFNTFAYSAVTAFAAISLTLAIAYVVNRKLVPFEQFAGVPVHGAVRGSRHRAGDRLLCRLRAAAARALWHRDDPDPGLHHALPANRLHLERGRPAQHQSGDGRGGTDPRRQPSSRHPQGADPAPEEEPRRRLDPGLHSGDAGIILGDLPGRARTPVSSR